MKYMAKELLSGQELLDNCRDIELRECNNAEDASKFTKEVENRGFELRLKRQKKDYNKIVLIELFFERKKK
jgi:hypothetical protein